MDSNFNFFPIIIPASIGGKWDGIFPYTEQFYGLMDGDFYGCRTTLREDGSLLLEIPVETMEEYFEL